MSGGGGSAARPGRRPAEPPALWLWIDGLEETSPIAGAPGAPRAEFPHSAARRRQPRRSTPLSFPYRGPAFRPQRLVLRHSGCFTAHRRPQDLTARKRSLPTEALLTVPFARC